METNNLDREYIADIKGRTKGYTENETAEAKIYAGRLYGQLRREGRTPEEANEVIEGIEHDVPEFLAQQDTCDSALEALDKARDERIESKMEDERRLKRIRTQILLEYKETLINPEDYLYHGVNGDKVFAVDSIVKNGLRGESGQISFWNGNDELHKRPTLEDFHGFGNAFFLRTKRESLSQQGFELDPEKSAAPVTHAVKTKASIPAEDLEIWDDEISLWRPIIDYAKEAKSQ